MIGETRSLLLHAGPPESYSSAEALAIRTAARAEATARARTRARARAVGGAPAPELEPEPEPEPQDAQGDSCTVAEFEVGSSLVAMNPKYRDGTRLREGPSKDSAFKRYVLNDSDVTLLKLSDDRRWGEIEATTAAGPVVGWIQVILPTARRSSPLLALASG